MTQANSKLPARKEGGGPVKHCLWVDFKRVKLDGRTALAKAINQMRGELVKHVGSNPSIAEALLIDRITHKAMKAHIYETNFFFEKGQGSNDHYLALVNSLRLDLQALGLRRSEKKVLDLNEYLLKKTKGDHDRRTSEKN